ncbi:TIR domain-containing protein [Pseudorhodoplanes sp.]|uniref:TIR domain-containing protein n=1 Tax=Pseudorhodoplanes sp. TaxID=1934341 RepID=UPI003D0D999E
MAGIFDDDAFKRAMAVRALQKATTIPQAKNTIIGGALDFTPPPALPTTGLGSIFGSQAELPKPRSTLASLLDPQPKPQGLFGLTNLVPTTPKPALPVVPVKRKVFFSFHYKDIIRVNNIRMAWNIDHPDRDIKRNFYDKSLWESAETKGREALKSLIRNGMKGSSTVCVLIGSETWDRPFVKYEIARSLVESKGLFAVHINGLNHHHRKAPDPFGFNPLHLMGVYKAPNGSHYIAEKRNVVVNYLTGQAEWQWQQYGEYTAPITRPRYLPEMATNEVVPLSQGTVEYYYDPKNDLGSWIDQAARAVGR